MIAACRLQAACIVFALLAIPGPACAHTKPLPRAGGYVAGFTATKLSYADAASIYEKWKREYLKSDCGFGTYRVEFQSPVGSTVSEGMGYGMLLTVYFDDRAEFDGLWKFAQDNLNANGLMGWKVTCAGFDASAGGAGSATDGDIDIALSLVTAVDQWGEVYRQAALEYLKAIRAHDYTTCSTTGRVMATNGDWDNGCRASNSSYWAPAYDRVFEEFTHDAFWGQAANDAIALSLANRNATTGLVANEVNQDGATAEGQSYVDYNGCRVPWRAVLDYVWYGAASSKSISDRITDWVDAEGPKTLLDGYNTDGTRRAGSHWNGSDCFAGGYATAAMSKSQDRVDRFTKYFMSLTVDNYYETSLRALYALMLSGHFWKPGPPPVAALPGSLLAPSSNDPVGLGREPLPAVRQKSAEMK